MKALTIRQPWAGLIACGVKDVENRSWTPGTALAIGERFAIHAGTAYEMTDVDDDYPLCRVHGVIIATVRLVDVTRTSSSEWANPGSWHWVLDSPRRTRSTAHVVGRMGLWDR
jgi:hypothetical protein